MRTKRNLVFLLVLIILIFSVFSASKNVFVTKNNNSTALITPASAVLALSHTGPERFYPNPSLTPGDSITGVTSNEICKSGYSSSVRNVPVSEKRQVYEEYGISYPQPQGSYEVDHFISLELGGSNDIKNLWPEPANPTPGFHEKDKVENYLHSEVCSGSLTLEKAQEEIKNDWYGVYLSISK